MKIVYSCALRHVATREMYRTRVSRFLSPTPFTERNADRSPSFAANARNVNRFFSSSEVRLVETPEMSSKAK
jgi:hypothetical protein